MSYQRDGTTTDVNLRPIVGLLSNAPEQTIEILTVSAIKKHRILVERAESLFQLLAADDGVPHNGSDDNYLAYLEATIEMHAQMSALTTLISILGRTPKVSSDQATPNC